MSSKAANSGRTEYVTRKYDIEERIARVETAVEGIHDDMSEIRRGQTEIANRIEREFTRIRESTRPNYAVWVALGSLVAFLFIAIGSAAYVPVWITTNNINAKAQAALDWQNQFQAGRLPVPSMQMLAELNQKLQEVETQFRGNEQIRNIQFAELQRKQQEFQNALHDKPYPLAPSSPYYFPKMTPDSHDGSIQGN